jgi:hypothetical protein
LITHTPGQSVVWLTIISALVFPGGSEKLLSYSRGAGGVARVVKYLPRVQTCQKSWGKAFLGPGCGCGSVSGSCGSHSSVCPGGLLKYVHTHMSACVCPTVMSLGWGPGSFLDASLCCHQELSQPPICPGSSGEAINSHRCSTL